MTTIAVRPAAQGELADIVAWYENQEPESSAPFIMEYEIGLKQIEAYPLLRPKVEGEIRHISLSAYPYQIWYFADEPNDHVEVLSITHQRRDRAAVLKTITQRSTSK